MVSLESTSAFKTLIMQRSKLGINTLISERCPRCNGTMIIEIETDYSLSCINCGHVKYLNQPVPLN